MVILDASIILKWFVNEEGSAEALIFRDRHVRGKERIIVPSLLFYEVANVLRYRKELPDKEIINLMEILKDFELSAVHLSFSELEEAMLYARIKDISVYDAAYVVLARNLSCDLITADKRLEKSVNESFVKSSDVKNF